MKKTEITINLFDSNSVKKAIEALEAYKVRLEEKAQLLVNAFADHGVEVAKAIIVGLPYSTGDLESRITAVYDEKNHCAMFRADGDHALFVEFGTGIGEGTYTNDEYLSEAGWDYFTGGKAGKQFKLADGREGWITVMNDGQVRFTRGQEAKHYMDDAVKSIIEHYTEIVRQVFEND